jgi:hypothetical protein
MEAMEKEVLQVAAEVAAGMVQAAEVHKEVMVADKLNIFMRLTASLFLL